LVRAYGLLAQGFELADVGLKFLTMMMQVRAKN